MNARHSYACLDGVRGWAAVMVAYSHFVGAMHPAMLGAGDGRAHFAAAGALGRSGLVVFYNPEFGLDVFLVISGFVLATSVTTRPAPLIELVVRRWLRLALPILATTALIWPLVNFKLFWPEQAGALSKSLWLQLCYNYNWLSLTSYPYMTLERLFRQSLFTVFIDSEHWYNPALWMMKTEFWASVGIFTVYCLIPARFLRRGAGLLLALAAVVLTWQVPLLESIVFGVTLFEARRLSVELGVTCTTRTAATAGIALLAAALLLGGLPYDAGNGVYARIYDVLNPYVGVLALLGYRVAALCIVAALLIWPPLQRPLLTRASQWLGHASYIIYLVHVPVLCSLGAWLLLRLDPVLGYNAATVVILPVFLAATLTVAGFGARWIDDPSNRVSRLAGAAVMAASRAIQRAVVPGLVPSTAKAER
jgi:peptidoglycan/LPS O-acetylase OafA/YrhL